MGVAQTLSNGAAQEQQMESWEGTGTNKATDPEKWRLIIWRGGREGLSKHKVWRDLKTRTVDKVDTFGLGKSA